VKKLLFIVGSIILCVTFLVGFSACSSSSTSAPATPSTSAPPTTPATTPAAATKTLKFAIPVPPGSIPVNTAEEWAQNFNAAAGGQYTMEVKPLLVGMGEMLSAIRSGSVEMGCGSLASWSGDDPRFAVSYLPFMMNNFEANHLAWKLALERLFSDVIMKKYNIKVLASEDYGFKDVYGNKPVQKLEDWKGLLADCESNLEAKTIEALGGSAVPIPWVDEIPSLQKGVIDAGTTTCWSALLDIKYYDVVKYATKADMKGTHGAYIMNADVFNAMPKDIQDLIVSGSQWFEETLNARQKASADASYPGMQQHGVNVTILSDTERARWIAATKPVVDAWWASIDAESAKILQGCINDANNKFPRQ
jgi:TRAP-type C4-dicarboxylate transport system substrate-binding protein